MPTYSLTIAGVSIPKSNCIMPAKYNDHLDEQLDMATVSVFGVTTEIFKPFCKVTITAEGAPRENEPTIVKHYRLMSDMGTESPNGTGFYRHELLLIEETKYLEGFMVESLCVTNAGGRNYTQKDIELITTSPDTDNPTPVIDPLPSEYKTPMSVGVVLALPSLSENFLNIKNILIVGGDINITYSDGEVQNFDIPIDGQINQNFTTRGGITIVDYVVRYNFVGSPAPKETTTSFSFVSMGNRYPLKPWTIKEVINRALELVEPLVWDESPTMEETQETSMMVTLSGNPPSFSNTGSISRGTITSAVITNREVFLQYGIRISISHTDTTYTVTASAPSGTITPILTAEIKLTVEQPMEETQETSMMVTLSGNPPSFSNTGSISRGTITSAVITNREVFLQYGIRISISHTDTTYTVTASAPSGTITPILTAEIKLTVEQAGNYVVPPRFKFRYMDESDAHEIAIFDGLAPEFTFTRCTLRELLQTIGGAIHREPRLDENNAIYFVPLGGTERAIYRNRKDNYNIKELRFYPYMKKTSTWELEQACTRLDSYVDNLVNQISLGDATVGQPYLNGAQSLRTDSSYIRVNEESGIFPTVFPILKINRFSWVDIENIAGGGVKKYDITAFLFEKSVYDSQLSSYTTAYPVSKAFGLYYTQGQKNIGGLFFENTEWTSGVLAQPAIVNILRAVTGKDNLLSGAEADDYAKLCFELEYTPIYSARVQHGKQYLGDYLVSPRTMAHNQSANQVEAQYYGENIKGMAQRLGNVEKAYTFFCEYASTIPTAGQMWDDDYCISDVAVELLADYFKVTVGLTKNFNRKSKYIGANSYRRIYEISERMVQERQSIYTDYLVVTDREAPAPEYAKNMFCDQYNFFNNLVQTFLQSSANATIKISSVLIQGKTKNGKETLPQVILPVIASAFGNVMEFSWEFKDNFSAGQRIVYQNNEGVTGYFTTEVQYCDYYGRMYYEDVILCSTLATACEPDSFPLYEEYGSNGPIKMMKLPENCTIIKRKDSREALKENYSVEFNTDIKGVIIGSALPANNPLVSGLNPKAKAKLVILRTPVNKFSRKVNLSTENIAAEYEVTDNMIGLNAVDKVYCAEADGITATTDGKAWAYVTPIYEGDPYTVEDEDGNVETITPSYGGELLIGRNIDIASGDTIGAFRIFPTHDVFSYMKQKEEQEA